MSGLGHSSWQTFRGTFHRLATLKAEGLDSFRPDMIRIPVTDGVRGDFDYDHCKDAGFVPMSARLTRLR